MLQFKNLSGTRIPVRGGTASISYDCNVHDASRQNGFRRIVYLSDIPPSLLEGIATTFPSAGGTNAPTCEPLLLPFLAPMGFDASGLSPRLLRAVKQTPGIAPKLSYAEQVFHDDATCLSANIGLVVQNSELSMTVDLGRGLSPQVLARLVDALHLDPEWHILKTEVRIGEPTIALRPVPEIIESVAQRARVLPAEIFA